MTTTPQGIPSTQRITHFPVPEPYKKETPTDICNAVLAFEDEHVQMPFTHLTEFAFEKPGMTKEELARVEEKQFGVIKGVYTNGLVRKILMDVWHALACYNTLVVVEDGVSRPGCRNLDEIKARYLMDFVYPEVPDPRTGVAPYHVIREAGLYGFPVIQAVPETAKEFVDAHRQFYQPPEGSKLQKRGIELILRNLKLRNNFDNEIDAAGEGTRPTKENGYCGYVERLQMSPNKPLVLDLVPYKPIVEKGMMRRNGPYSALKALLQQRNPAIIFSDLELQVAYPVPDKQNASWPYPQGGDILSLTEVILADQPPYGRRYIVPYLDEPSDIARVISGVGAAILENLALRNEQRMRTLFAPVNQTVIISKDRKKMRFGFEEKR